MRAVRFHGRDDVRIDDIDEPVAASGEVKLRCAFNGICGSDLHEYRHGPAYTSSQPHPLTGAALPAILGHEFSGTVIEVGPGVDDIEIGTRVAVEPIETCGVCPACVAGRRNVCSQLAFHGYTRAGGGLSEFTTVLRSMVHPLPDGLSLSDGALVEPMAVAHRAARHTEATAGDVVLVMGAGPIGIGVHLSLRDLGVTTILADTAPERRATAAALGAIALDPKTDDVVAAARDLTGGLGVKGAVDAAGVQDTFSAALAATMPGGTVVLVAHHQEPIRVRSISLIGMERRVVGSLIYLGEDFANTIEAMSRGAFPTDAWVTTVAFDDVVRVGIAALEARQATKVIVDIEGTAHT